jgi:hypothetical protein
MKTIYLLSLFITLLSSCTCVPARPPVDDDGADTAHQNFREFHAHRFEREH